MAAVLDANVILRYLLWDNEEQACIARQAIEVDGASVYIEVLAEVVYVLEGVYKRTRAEIDQALELLLDDVSVFDEDVIRATLRMYAMGSLDFIDCWLVARNTLLSEPVLTFDKKLKRHLR